MIQFYNLRKITIYHGWWVVGALFLSTSVCVGASQYAFSLFIEPLEESFGWSRTQISASLSFSAVGALMAPVLGRIMDRRGAKPIILTSLLLTALSFALRPLMSELWHWYGLSVLQFIGMSGATNLPIGRLVGIWFPETQGRVIGLASMGNNFGGLCIPPILATVLLYSSWKMGYFAFAIITIAVIAIVMITVKEYPKGGNSTVVGLNSQEITGTPKFTAIRLTGWTVRMALRSKTFYIITVAVLMGSFTYSTILPQIVVHLTNEGVSVRNASLALTLVALFGMVGKLVFGYLAEKITAKYALMICLTGQAIFALLLVRTSSPLILLIVVPLFGLFMGAFGALLQLIVQENFGVRSFGSIMGLINFTTVVPCVVGPILAGASFDLTGDYGVAFITVSILFIIAALMVSQLTPTRGEL